MPTTLNDQSHKYWTTKGTHKSHNHGLLLTQLIKRLLDQCEQLIGCGILWSELSSCCRWHIMVWYNIKINNINS